MPRTAQDLFAPPGDAPVVTVSDLNRCVRELLEGSIPLLWVGGEISNFVCAASGHWYFHLKDARAQVRCVMFRSRAQLLDWRPENGMQVEAHATITLYEARGEFQLSVDNLRRAGLGLLFERFERLKAKLAAEGLFDESRKRPLPSFPRRVGVVTSTAGAALHDVLTTLRRRMPSIAVIIYPTPVQGADAAPRVAAAIGRAAARAECEVLIVCRGGGSIEDLWPFNEEVVARAIAACPLPVICGVGHETDFTIADFVADRRAPTPTAAAEMVSPDRHALLARVEQLRSQLGRGMLRGLEQRMQRLDRALQRLTHPGERLARQRERLQTAWQRFGRGWRSAATQRAWQIDTLRLRLSNAQPQIAMLTQRQAALGDRLQRALARRVEQAGDKLARIASQLGHLDPTQVLARGYSIVSAADGRIIADVASIAVGDELGLTFARGAATARVTGKP